MALEDDVKKALKDAGEQLKKDLWKPEDDAFLAARAEDLVGLNAKALTVADPVERKAHLSAAADVVNHVRVLALIRVEVAAAHIVDALGRFFMETVLRVLVKLLPGLLALV